MKNAKCFTDWYDIMISGGFVKGVFMEIQAVNILHKDYNDDEDFFLSCEVFIGPENKSHEYEVYSFDVISIKRLYEAFQDCDNPEIMLNKGLMITKYYDENEVKEKIKSIIKICISDSDEKTYIKIGSYFRMQDSEYYS